MLGTSTPPERAQARMFLPPHRLTLSIFPFWLVSCQPLWPRTASAVGIYHPFVVTTICTVGTTAVRPLTVGDEISQQPRERTARLLGVQGPRIDAPRAVLRGGLG